MVALGHALSYHPGAQARANLRGFHKATPATVAEQFALSKTTSQYHGLSCARRALLVFLDGVSPTECVHLYVDGF